MSTHPCHWSVLNNGYYLWGKQQIRFRKESETRRPRRAISGRVGIISFLKVNQQINFLKIRFCSERSMSIHPCYWSVLNNGYYLWGKQQIRFRNESETKGKKPNQTINGRAGIIPFLKVAQQISFLKICFCKFPIYFLLKALKLQHLLVCSQCFPMWVLEDKKEETFN